MVDSMDDLYLKELERIQGYLKDMEYDSRILKKSDIFPIHSLLAGVEQDYLNRDRFVNMSFVPMPEDAKDIMLLQLYTTLPSAIKAENMETLRRLLLEMNNHTAVGQFGINNEGAACFRHVQVSVKGETIAPDVFKAALSVFVFMMDAYEETVEAVATGKMNIEDAIKSL